MKHELDQKLCKAFPRVFRNRHGSPMETAFAFGFECGDGWYDLLYKAASAIEREIINIKKEDPMVPDDELPCASQVKEKFGTLRFYMSFSNEAIDDIVTKAEEESEVTCEECGKFGELRPGGWYVTLCDACQAERLKPVAPLMQHED